MPRKIDALSLPSNFAAPNGTPRRGVAIDQKVKGWLGGKPNQTKDDQGRMFCRLNAHDKLYFPMGSERQFEPRYDWLLASEKEDGTLEVLDPPVKAEDMGEDAVGFIWAGYLKEGAELATSGVVSEAAQEAIQARIAQLQAAHREKMEANADA